MVAPPTLNVKLLHRLLKDHGLDVLLPKQQKKAGHFWVQLSSGPFDLEHNIPIFRKVAEDLRQLHDAVGARKPPLTKIDSTRDLRGSFYSPKDWKAKHKELG